MPIWDIPAPRKPATTSAPKKEETHSAGPGYPMAKAGVAMAVPAGHMPLKASIPGGNPMAGTNPFRKVR